jgi:hypothetical protein
MNASSQNDHQPETVTGTSLILCLYTFLSGHNNDPTKDAIQETHRAPPKKYGITLPAMYRHIFLTRQFIP